MAMDSLHIPLSGHTDPIFEADEWEQIATLLKLSPKQAQVARLLLLDYSEVDIANMLRMSKSTVHTHTERIYRKLAVSSRVQPAIRLLTAIYALRLLSVTAVADNP